MTNIFNEYFMQRLELFWLHNLENEIKLNTILEALRKVLNPKSIENYLIKLELSEDSKSLVYLILNESCRRATRDQETETEYELKLNPEELIDMIAHKWGEPPFSDLYQDIFNILEIEDFYLAHGRKMGFLDSAILYYERTSLFIPQEHRFELKNWLTQKRYLKKYKQYNKTKSHKEVTVLSVSQKLLVLHAMFEKFDIKIGRDINISDFLRFFQSLTNHELNVPYKDSSFRKEYTKLFTRPRAYKIDDFENIDQLLERAGLVDVRKWIIDKYKL